MPAMRRFLRCVAPAYFCSTKEDSRHKHYDDMNNVRTTMPRSSRLRSGLRGPGITKTIDTQVESQSNDDEIELVAIQGKGGA